MTFKSKPAPARLAGILAAALIWIFPVRAWAQHEPPRAAASQPGGSLTALDWRQDLRFLADTLPKAHLKLFHDMTRAEFDSAARKLDADMPSLDSLEIAVRLMQLCALIRDGHSGLRPSYGQGAAPRIPVRFDSYPEGVFVRAAAPEYASEVGGRVVAVGSVPIEEALKRADSIVSHDPRNDGLQRAWSAAMVFGNPVLLHGLGLAGPGGSAEFRVEKDGRPHAVTMKATDTLDLWARADLPKGFVDARPASAPVPLSISHAGEPQWLAVVPEHHAVYFQFNGVENGDSVSLEEAGRRLGRALDSPVVERLVIDLRNNGGGNNYLLRPLLLAIIRSQINHRGGLFALIGPKTFSAAQNFCNRLENYTEAIFVGEPTGQNVNFYGDTKSIELPHSRLRIAASYLWWQDLDPRDTRTATFPEIAMGRSFAEYVAGQDRALDLALTTPMPASIEDWLSSSLPEGADSLRARYDAWLAEPSHRYLPDPEARLNTFGYTLLGARRISEAVAVLDLVARTHPQSWNAFDSFGEALATAGQTPRAIEAYRHSLELNPRNENGKAILSRLEAGSK